MRSPLDHAVLDREPVDQALRIEHLSKTFPGQAALIDVDLIVEAGEVHALVGQNGSGKSTLIKVLAGYHQPDPGATASANNKPLTLGDGAAASAAGIRFVHQDLGLVASINTIENLALTNGYETGPGRRIRWRSEAKRAAEAMGSLGFADFDIKAPVANLAPAQRTAVAIARALVGWEQAASLLVLDEPTASLAADDKARLFEVVKTLKARGVSILYVSHHLDEVFDLADRVTVLRDARKVGTVPVADLDHDALVSMIVGHRVEFGTTSVAAATGKPIVTVAGLSGGNLHQLDLSIRPGEIVGISGIMGSGREHVIGLLAGQVPRDGGVVTVDGADIPNYAPAVAKVRGVAIVPADRSVRGAIGPFSVRENLTVTDVNRFVKAKRLRHSAERSETASWIDRLSIRLSGPEALIGSLSGGNQQKVMFAKALRLAPKLLLLDEPTQGVDIGAKDQIHALVDEGAANGAATLVASTDTDELVRLCHRVLVLVEGRVIAELNGTEIVAESIEQLQLQSARRAM
jgi:ribose transport system ATP-binding protein